MRAVVVGVGSVGARVARQLASSTGLGSLTLIDVDLTVAEEAATSLGAPARAVAIGALRLETRLERFREVCDSSDVVVLTAPGDHVEMAEAALRAGCHVVSISDDVETVEELLELEKISQENGLSMVVGAGFSPGLSCLLARHAAAQLDVVDEVHIAKFGTGGPACARQHHKALRSDALDWRNQHWERRRGGSGRELCWFPDPVGGLDCYQAAMPDASLVLRAFPEIVRASARVAATRRDRATKWLPMLRRPHPEGMIGAVRSEVRGWNGTIRDIVVLGALDRPAVAAGTVAANSAIWAHEKKFSRSGSGGLAELVEDTSGFLAVLAERGVRGAVFEGFPHNH